MMSLYIFERNGTFHLGSFAPSALAVFVAFAASSFCRRPIKQYRNKELLGTAPFKPLSHSNWAFLSCDNDCCGGIHPVQFV